jgi:hypothetical protein
MAASSTAMSKRGKGVVRPEGFEPPTYGFEARRSIQLSYGRKAVARNGMKTPQSATT